MKVIDEGLEGVIVLDDQLRPLNCDDDTGNGDADDENPEDGDEDLLLGIAQDSV